MSTMGISVFGSNQRVQENNNNNNSEQLMLLRTLQDNECNIIGNRVVVTTPTTPTPTSSKSNVSVIQPHNQRQDNQRNKHEQLPPYDPARLKKHGKNGQPPPIAVAKRNARERNRVKQVNNGFATLRQHIPSHMAQGYGDRGKKLSKVETLRMAVEYIRGLQRLLAEADGQDCSQQQQQQMSIDSPVMIPSPTGSVYSNSTHNGSSDIIGLDEQQSATGELDGENVDGDNYLLEDEDDDYDKRDPKRFREDTINRLVENQKDKTITRRRRASPITTYYVTTKQSTTFGDEENIEPLPNRNNNNNLLSTFTPILLQTSSPATTMHSSIKRELQLTDEDESCRSNEDDSGVILSTTSPYPEELLIENPENVRLIPLKLEGEHHEAAAQLVYVEGLPAAAYYRHELEAAAAAATTGTEFMDVVSWWDQDQSRGLVHQMPNQQQQRLAHV